MKKIIILILISILTISCRTHKISTNNIERDTITTYNTKLIHDSVYVYKSDSIIVKQKGDTLFIDRYHNIFSDKIKIRVDTFYKDKIKYINKSEKSIEYIEKKLKWWQKFLIWSGIISILIFFYYIYKKIK